MPLTKADEATGLEEQVSSFEDRAYACIKAAALGQDLSDVDVPPPAPNGDTPKITNVTGRIRRGENVMRWECDD